MRGYRIRGSVGLRVLLALGALVAGSGANGFWRWVLVGWGIVGLVTVLGHAVTVWRDRAGPAQPP